MGTKLYVGNLAYCTTNDELKQIFEAYGNVQSAEVIQDRNTGRSKGFGFVEMGSEEEAESAKAAINGQEIGGRALTVSDARPKQNAPQGNFRSHNADRPYVDHSRGGFRSREKTGMNQRY